MASWDDLYDWLPGIEDVEDAEARGRKKDALARALAKINADYGGRINDYATGRQEAPGVHVAKQQIREQYGQQGRGVLANAAQRGVLHSGQVQAYMGQIGRDQRVAEGRVGNDALQTLLQTLLQSWQIELGGFDRSLTLEQMYYQMSEEGKKSPLGELILKQLMSNAEQGGKLAAGAGGGAPVPA